MTNELTMWALVGLTLSAGLVAGVFLAFSDFIMPSLRDSAPAAGTEAMQLINRKVYRSIFMVLFLGLVPLSVLAMIVAVLFMEGSAAFWLAFAGALYFFGVFVVTAAGNVPMNKKLEAMPQSGKEAQRYWPGYVKGWVFWNHVRTAASFGSMAAYMIGALEIVAAV